MSFDYEMDRQAELGTIRLELKDTWDNQSLQGRQDWLNNINLDDRIASNQWDYLDPSVRTTIEEEYLSEMNDKYSCGD